MKTQILGLLAETSIHPGAGQSSGVVDLPVAREAATDYPVVPGSSLKGALLGLARSRALPSIERIFGQQENAGQLLVSDARLLLLPVRSLHTASKWVTCPHLLERFTRDSHRAGDAAAALGATVEQGKYLGSCADALFLEERQFTSAGPLPNGLVETLSKLIPHKQTRDRLAAQLIVLHDDDFAWFARHGLAVQARNVLGKEKTSENLWYEETIPPDALFYTLLAERQNGALDVIAGLFKDHPYLQAGGNETVGMGWFAVTWPAEKGGAT